VAKFKNLADKVQSFTINYFQVYCSSILAYSILVQMKQQIQSPGVDALRAKLFNGPPVAIPEERHDPLTDGTFTPRDVIEKTERQVDVLRNTLQNALREIRESQEKRMLSPQELRAGIDLLFQKHNFHPVEELITLALDGDTPLKERVGILKELASFVIPKVRSVEVSGEVNHKHTVEIVRFGQNGKIAERSPLIQRNMEQEGAPIVDLVEAEVEG
jgi:hypothetical protein